MNNLLYVPRLLGTQAHFCLWPNILEQEPIRLHLLAAITRQHAAKYPSRPCRGTPARPCSRSIIPRLLDIVSAVHATRYGIGVRDVATAS